ncbi:MAG: response regulator transcription factor [Clostridiaceae bacterium]|nr:response regulator transcription factor [Clostridiaceae bacterium]
MQKILIVEDDPAIAALIATSLTMSGYEQKISPNGSDALFCLQTDRFSLILLDVMLPGMDGFELMELIRGREIPVIFLTARDKLSDRVKGLRMGAEDYIVKPFEPMELIARIEVVLRRCDRASQPLQYDDIEVNQLERVVRQGDQIVQLTPKEFDLLVLLIEHADIALSRERILQSVWGYCFIGESRTVDMHIMQLRKKLDFHHKLKAVIKIGYRLDR